MSIELDQQIVIIDEAHNVEDSSREAASVSITKYQVEQALNDLNKILNARMYKTSEENQRVCHYFIGIVGFHRIINIFYLILI